MTNCRWLRPVLVAPIDFIEWTGDNHLRHTKFFCVMTSPPNKSDANRTATGQSAAATERRLSHQAFLQLQGILDGGPACRVVEHTPHLADRGKPAHLCRKRRNVVHIISGPVFSR